MRAIVRVLTMMAVVAAALAFVPPTVEPASAAVIGFPSGELLGKPTATSMTVNVVPARSATLRVQYGTSSGNYTSTTGTVSAIRNRGSEVTMTGLSPNTRYFYQLQYTTAGGVWESREEHTFTTQRARGSSFTFVLQSDSHIAGGPDTSSALYTNTVANMVADSPDFLIDLGDMFEVAGSASAVRSSARRQRDILEPLSADAAVYLAIGNHENEEGWWQLGNSTNVPIWSINARKELFANPAPDGFYTGDLQDNSALGVSEDGLRETYYAWEWGDALFIVLDPFWNTTSRPHTNINGSDPVETTTTGDRWDWTLGLDQYNWLYQTLAGSAAPYKFVMTHHLTGGSTTYGRGGAAAVDAGFEWGANDSTFATNRPGWSHGSIHQMLLDHDVQSVFHAHDHCYAAETKDGIVYQEVPMPNAADTTANFCGGYSGVIDNSGHVRVDVAPTATTVSYVRSTLDAATNAAVQGAYTLAPVIINNSPPSADAGANQVVTDTDENGSEPVTLDGSGSTDDFAIDGYRWLAGTDELATGVSPTIELAVGTHLLTLEVTDIYGLTDTDTVSVTVSLPPVADAGPDQIVIDTNDDGVQRAVFDGTGSSDPGGAITSYVWTENGSQLATGSGPSVALSLGTHVISLEVSDSSGATAADTFTVRVISPPLIPDTDGGVVTVQARYRNDVDVAGFSGGAASVTVRFIDSNGGPTCDDLVTQNGGGNPGCDLQQGWTTRATGDGGPAVVTIHDLAMTGFGVSADTVDVAIEDPGGQLTFGCGGSVAIGYGGDVDYGAEATRMVPGPRATIDFSEPGPCGGMFDDATVDVVIGAPVYLTAWDADGDRTLEIREVQHRFNCPSEATSFGDVPTTSFAYDDIKCIYGLDLTTGTSSTTFSPHDLVTREQMASFLARLARLLGVDIPDATHPFSDVSPTSFANDDIALIYALGVTKGTSATTYSPGNHVTREQMASFLARLYAVLFGTPSAPVLAWAAATPFIDVPATSFAHDDVGRIYGLDLTQGTSPTTYSPGNHVTREQMASFLARLVRILNFV